jgi:hypothetical protein
MDNIERTVVQISIESALDLARKGLYKFNLTDEEKALKEDITDTRRKDSYSTFLKNTAGIREELIEGDVTFTYEDGNQLYLKNCTMNLSRTKRIVQTAINGQTGTLKEWITDGDIIISLQVEILDNEDNFPITNILSMKLLFEQNTNLKIDNRVLNELGVTRVVVSRWNWQPQTWSNHQTLNVDLVQDDTYLIEEQILK